MSCSWGYFTAYELKTKQNRKNGGLKQFASIVLYTITVQFLGYKLKGRTCQNVLPFPDFEHFFLYERYKNLPVLPTKPVFLSFSTRPKISLTIIRKKVGNFQSGQSKNIIDPIFGSVQTISTA